MFALRVISKGCSWQRWRAKLDFFTADDVFDLEITFLLKSALAALLLVSILGKQYLMVPSMPMPLHSSRKIIYWTCLHTDHTGYHHLTESFLVFNKTTGLLACRQCSLLGMTRLIFCFFLCWGTHVFLLMQSTRCLAYLCWEVCKGLWVIAKHVMTRNQWPIGG